MQIYSRLNKIYYTIKLIDEHAFLPSIIKTTFKKLTSNVAESGIYKVERKEPDMKEYIV